MHPGIEVDDAFRRAARLRSLLPYCLTLAADADDGLADALFALSDLLIEMPANGPGPALNEIAAAFDLVSGLSWPTDELGERRELLTRLAYAGWNHCRRWATYSQTKLWQERCVGHALNQEVVRDFLGIPFGHRSLQLNDRFLSDPSILLATCVQFENDRNRLPAMVADNAPLAYQWVQQRVEAGGDSEDLQFFSGDLALSVAVGLKQLGRVSAARGWLAIAQGHFSRTSNSEPHLARTDFCRVAVLQDCYESEQVLRLLPPIVASLEKHKVFRELNYARLLEAVALKDSGRPAEAIQRLTDMSIDISVRRDPLALGLVLIGLAELHALAGFFDRALDLFSEAMPVVDQARAPIVTGQFYGCLGEGLRDRGLLREAENAYRIGIAAYSRAGMRRREAYVRVILSETLLADGRDVEAATELLAAMPTITSEKLTREGSVAVALLNESLRRQKLSAKLLRELREQLSTVKNGDNE